MRKTYSNAKLKPTTLCIKSQPRKAITQTKAPIHTFSVNGHAKKMEIKIAILLIFLSIKTFGTAQIPDRLIYKGDTLALFYCPLELHPNKELSTPKNLFESSGCFYTACWRNYVATWTVEDDSLFLLEIRNACYPTDLENVQASFKSNEMDYSYCI